MNLQRFKIAPVDEYGYRINWQGRASSATIHTTVNEVTPSDSNVNAYRNWDTGFDASCPVVSYMVLSFATSYSVRENKPTASGDEEWRNDYDTWSTKLGTSVAVTRKIDFTTYVQHVERLSDSEDLEYERDTVSAVFTFKHRF